MVGLIATADLITDLTLELIAKSRLVASADQQCCRAALANVLGSTGVWSRNPEQIDLTRKLLDAQEEINRLRRELGQEIKPHAFL